MPKPKQFNLLMVRDDGSRVLRLSVPGWAVGVVVGGLAITILGLAFIYPDYVSLRHQRGTFAALSERLHIQQGLLDASQSRLREIRGEIDSWRDLHAKIWEPFGPEASPVKRGTGIGGKTAAEPDRGPVKEEVDRLLGIVREEGESIRTLERFLGRASRVLASLPSRWPVRGPVNSDFGQRRSPWAPNSEFHSGIDIGAPIGTSVRAPAPGVVIFAGQHAEYGVTLVIDHGNDTRSLYGHLSRLNVAMDQAIKRGRHGRDDREHGPLLRSAPALRDPGQGPAGEPPQLHLGGVAGRRPVRPLRAARGASGPAVLLEELQVGRGEPIRLLDEVQVARVLHRDQLRARDARVQVPRGDRRHQDVLGAGRDQGRHADLARGARRCRGRGWRRPGARGRRARSGRGRPAPARSRSG